MHSKAVLVSQTIGRQLVEQSSAALPCLETSSALGDAIDLWDEKLAQSGKFSDHAVASSVIIELTPTTSP